MRLSAAEVEAIAASVRETWGPSAVVRLFGSRVHDHLRGGDIDLLIEVPEGETGIGYEVRFLNALFERIDERKVDLVLYERDRDPGVFARSVLGHALVLA